MNNIIIRVEEDGDRDAIRVVHREAFRSDAEPDLVDALRDGFHSQLSLVAEEMGNTIVGHLMLSRVMIESPSGTHVALSLAPVGVMPGYQRRKIGSNLILSAIAKSRAQGHGIVLVLGQPAYYRRFGFRSDLAEVLESPFGGGEAWMAMELIPASLRGVQGTVVFSPPFMALLNT